jgi:hypothetical protein
MMRYKIEIVDGVDLSDFSEWVSIGQLQDDIIANIQLTIDGCPGVYVALRPDTKLPKFIYPGTGGTYQRKNPNVLIPVLEENWIHNASILYIGKAEGLHGLKQRIRQFMRFGMGNSSPHRGGRYIWQLEESRNLKIMWKAIGHAALEESRMLHQFHGTHGRLPFANLRF